MQKQMPVVGEHGAMLWVKLCDSGANCLRLRVQVENIVAHFAAPAGLLVTSERQPGIEDVVTVDPDSARAKLLGHKMRLANIARPYGSGETVVAVIGARDDLLGIGERHGRHHWSEDFFLHHFHVLVGVYQNRGFDEVPAIASLVATGHGFGSLGESRLEITADSIQLLL